MKRLVHLRKKAREICSKLRLHGFGGVHFDEARVEEEMHSDFPGETNKAQFATRERDYLCMIVQPIFRNPWASFGEDNDYVSVEVNEGKFYRDFEKYLRAELGPNLTINFSEGCFEYEIYRPYKHGGRYCYDHFHPKSTKKRAARKR